MVRIGLYVPFRGIYPLTQTVQWYSDEGEGNNRLEIHRLLQTSLHKYIYC